MRQRLLAQIQARLSRFATSQDPDAVLSQDALRQVTELLHAVADPATDLEIANAAGWLYWYRYLTLESGEDQQDLALALALLAPVYQERPDAVPDELRQYFMENPATGLARPEAMVAHAVELLAQTLSTGDPGALSTAIDLLQWALAATPADEPVRLGYLSNLAGALQIRFARTGTSADLDQALEVGEQAVAAAPAEDPNRAKYLSNLGHALQARLGVALLQ